MQSNPESMENRLTYQRWSSSKIYRLINNYKHEVFLLLLIFMAAWGWGTLYEITREPAYLLHQSIYLGIAIIVFVLIQIIDLKWLAKTYWIWLPLAVIGNSIVWALNPETYMDRFLTIHGFTIDMNYISLVAFLIFFAGLLAKGSRDLQSSRNDNVTFRQRRQTLVKWAWVLYVLAITWVFYSYFLLISLTTLIISCIITMFVIKKYGMALKLTGAFLVWQVLMLLAIPCNAVFHQVFHPDPYLSTKVIQLLKAGGIGGQWKLMTTLEEIWRFANGDYVFATIGQVHGLLGITCLLLVFLLFGYFGWLAARRSEDRFSAALILSSTIFLELNVFLSCLSGCGSIGLLRFAIPFFTYGGGNLIFGAFCAGLIFKQLRSKSEVNPFQVKFSKAFLIMAGLALLIWIKAIWIMA